MGVEPTSDKASEYIWFGDDCLRRARDTGISGHEAIVDGIYIVVCKFTPEKAILIVLPGSGNFISTPRKFQKNDGYDENLQEQGDGTLEYPLDDETNTSQCMLIDGSDVSVNRSSQLYGNIDWISADKDVLTWKGPVGRTLPFDYRTEITGLTTPDIQFRPDSPEYYTCFGPNIYSFGEIYETIPTERTVTSGGQESKITSDVDPKVLGCAITKLTTTDQTTGIETISDVLIAIVNNHYADKIGFVREVWVKYSEGWKIIDSQADGRPTQCWFFNQSGNKCTQSNKELEINVTEKTVTEKIYPNEDLKFNLTSDSSGRTETKYSGTTNVWSDYKGDRRVTARIDASGGQIFTSTSSSSTSTIDATVYVLGKINQTIFVSISGSQATATVSGTGCACTNGVWSISSGTITQAGLIDKLTGCGTATVTYACSTGSGSAEIKMDNGAWIRSGCYTDLSVAPLGTYVHGGGAGDLFKTNQTYGTKKTSFTFQFYSCDLSNVCRGPFTSGSFSLCTPARRPLPSSIFTGPTTHTLSGDNSACPNCASYSVNWQDDCWALRFAEDFVWGCAGDTPSPPC